MADVVIIDDDATIAGLNRDRLVKAGLSVEVLDSPLGSTVALRANKPKLVIVDVNMPAMHGDKLVSLLRQARGLDGMRIMLFSSIDDVELQAMAQASGADGWLNKMAPRSVFVRKVQDLLAGG